MSNLAVPSFQLSPDVAHVLHTPPQSVVASRQRFVSVFSCYIMFSFFLTENQVKVDVKVSFSLSNPTRCSTPFWTVAFSCRLIICLSDYSKTVFKRSPFVEIGWESNFLLRSPPLFSYFCVIICADFEKIVENSQLTKLIYCI